MCDTVVVLGNATADGVAIFGKNSDRHPNEAHEIVRIPRARHAPESMVKCTYIEIPQVAQTYEVLLSKPFWMWGGEMGSNEFGVTIGNEAVFTRVRYNKQPGLLGMDLLRLALERGKTAREALNVITLLLEQYGQGGNAGYARPFYYHNSFIIADPHEAWLLETVDHHWAAMRIKDIRTISNGLTIHHDWDMLSPDVVSFALDRRLMRRYEDFDFAETFNDPIMTRLSNCNERQCRTTDLLTARKGKITVQTVMSALRDHGMAEKHPYDPARGLLGHAVCMHTGFGPVRSDQTTGSMVSHLAEELQTHFVTATAAPCTSIFKPLWLGNDLPYMGSEPGGIYDDAALFWRHEVLHRTTLRDYDARIKLYAADRDGLEADFIQGARALRKASKKKRAAYSAKCFADAERAEQVWRKRVQASPEPEAKDRMKKLYLYEWRKLNEAAQLPLLGAKTEIPEPILPEPEIVEPLTDDGDPLEPFSSADSAATSD